MPRPFLEELENALTRGGIAPFYVHRTLLELREHYAALQSDALAAGMSREEADAAARAALGSEPTIASVILGHPELLAWSYRWPRAALCLQMALVIATFPEAPVLFCVDHCAEIARWTVAVGVATLLVGSLLSCLNSLLVLA